MNQEIKHRHILIIGSFYHPQNKRYYTSAAEQLAALFHKQQIPVITTTKQYGKFSKMLSTLYDIVRNNDKYAIAILPLYGTPLNFIWHRSAAVLLKLLGKKLIVVVHGGSIPEQISKGAQKFFKALNRADRIVCPSGFIADFLKHYGYNATVIENVLDIGSYPFQSKQMFRPHIFWMRSFSEIYNPQMAVRVAALLADKYPDFKMVMAGSDHGLLEVTKALINEKGLQEKILLPGYIDHAHKIIYAGGYDIFVNTNNIDNAPVTVVENMALGLAVVSVNTGGIPYLVNDGITGLLVAPDDHEQMAEAIARVIHKPAFAAGLCENARRRALDFDEAPVMAKWRVLLAGIGFYFSR